jgi:hypothetical protein
VFAGAALRADRYRVALGAWWIPEQSLGLGAGSVKVMLAAASLGGCASASTTSLSDTWDVSVCARALAAMLRGRGDGYSLEAAAVRPWFAGYVGPALAVVLVPRLLSLRRLHLGVGHAAPQALPFGNEPLPDLPDRWGAGNVQLRRSFASDLGASPAGFKASGGTYAVSLSEFVPEAASLAAGELSLLLREKEPAKLSSRTTLHWCRMVG